MLISSAQTSLPTSAALFDKASRVLPGGVNSPVRAFRAVGGHPFFAARGEGAYLWDVDGNSYIDFVSSWGPLILGHAAPQVQQSIKDAVNKGMSFGVPTEAETTLAEMIVDAFPAIEMVRFVNSGTEATMSALRLARAYTRRDKVIKFDGCYHGHSDMLLVGAGSGVTTFGLPGSVGIPKNVIADTYSLPYNDLSSLEALLSQHPDEFAAIIIEPVAGNMGVVLPGVTYLADLRNLCDVYGTLLIFDEVITGFRVEYGGYQTLCNIEPDITCLGKIIGGGLPIGAFGGKRDIMKLVAPEGPVYQAGTLSGNPLSMAGGLATLQACSRPGVHQQLEDRSDRLCNGIREAAQFAGVTVQQNRIGSMQCTFFAPHPVRDYDTAKASNTGQYAAFFQGMLDRGVYLPPSQFETTFVSLAHGEAEIDIAIAAAHETMADIAK